MFSFSRMAGAVVCAALIAPPATAFAGDFVDTRLTFVFSDEDVLHGAGETIPSSPAARFSANRNSTLFFDNYDTKFTGFETLSNLVLYKRDESHLKNLITEAALALNLLVAGPDSIRFQDASSYVRLTYRPAGWGQYEGLSFTGFPISADRFRLGYSYRLSWAGNRIFIRAPGDVPNSGFKLQLTRGPVYVFVGAKATLLGDDETGERETNYGGLAGAGWDITQNLRWEAGGGLFQRGTNPYVEGDEVTAGGVSTQLSWHVGIPIGTSIDFRLYKNDPEVYQRFFQPEIYPGGFSYILSAEATYLTQNLQDADEFGSTRRQEATAGDLQAKFKIDKTRLHFTASYRSLEYVLFNVPSLEPYRNLPEDAEIDPEFFVAVGGDYFIESLRLTPGLVAGVQMPAAVTTGLELGSNPPPTLQGRRTVVVRDEGFREILPPGEEARPIYSVKGSARMDLSDSMQAAGEVYYTYDQNRSTIVGNPGGNQNVRVYNDFDQLGFNLLLQARF